MPNVLNTRTVGWYRGVYIGRLRHTPNHFGNPFVIGKDGTREQVVDKYKSWLDGTAHQDVEPARRQWILANLHTLRGKNLRCFCAPLKCHGDVLLRLANAQE